MLLADRCCKERALRPRRRVRAHKLDRSLLPFIGLLHVGARRSNRTQDDVQT